MSAALRWEWVRVTTVRSTYITLVLTLVFAGLVAWLIAGEASGQVDVSGNPVPAVPPWFPAFGMPLILTAVLASVVAAQSIGQEYRFGLVRLTLTAMPRRLPVLTAKVVGVIGAAIVFSLVSFAGSWIGVTLRGYPTVPEGLVWDDGTYLLRGVVFVVVWALSAFALAGILRQTALGIAIPIISGLVVENLLAALLFDRAEWLVRVLPWSTAARWSESVSQPDAPLPVAWAALGVFGAWVVLLLALEYLSFLRRDA